MGRRKKRPPLPDGWTRSERFQWNGRHIERGTELSIRGARGRYRFLYHTTTPTSEWIDVVGGPGRGAAQVRQWRAFRPERIRTVHRTRQTISPSEAIDLIRQKKREKRDTTPKEHA